MTIIIIIIIIIIISNGIALVTRLNLPGCLIQHLLSLYSVGNGLV